MRTAATLPINEVFDTIQGEATHTGTPATFLRLQGCGVGCPWCDTRHTWELDPAHEDLFVGVQHKTREGPTYARVEVPMLANWLIRQRPQAVVVTGGEPCQYDLTELTGLLAAEKALVQVETSGTEDVRVHPHTWVTLSPKVGMPGGRSVQRPAVERANEIKWPVGKRADIDHLLNFIGRFDVPPSVPVWLQPLSRSLKATELCIAEATAHGFRVSVQVHALLGLR